MAVTAAREQEYVKAVMYLGPAPRPAKRIGPDSAARGVQTEVDAYKRSWEYGTACDDYYLTHVSNRESLSHNAVSSHDAWVTGFYAWQRADRIECIEVHDEQTLILSPHDLHACKGERQ